MPSGETTAGTDPCAAQKANRKAALAHERRCERNLDAAWKSFRALQSTVTAAVWARVRRALEAGEWPEDDLGPLDSLIAGYPSVTFVKYARRVYFGLRDLLQARAAAEEAFEALRACEESEAYQEWRASCKRLCGAPCTSRRREGQPCRHPLGPKNRCPNHGPRP
jgi:hypothetical protein